MGEEEKALERELEEQIVEHKASLDALQKALVQDPSNREISSLCDELVDALKGSEETLLYFKRTRLLRELESQPQGEEVSNSAGEIEVEEHGFIVGSKCRFRHTDGRWYNGKVIDLCNDGTNARVSFLTPTTESMQICRFYLQQRCRYGDSCRSSHGFRIQLSALRHFTQLKWEQLEVGTTVLACTLGDGTGLWRDAEVEKLDRHCHEVGVVFIHDGTRSSLGVENLALSEHAIATDDSSSSSSSESDDSDSEVTPGIGYSGQQTETVTFANWEKHTRGVASKMMAKMGYRQGTGLGSSSQGLVVPLQVRVVPPKTSIDFLNETGPEGTAAEGAKLKKKTRGGKRKRDKKFAEAVRASKAQQEGQDVFDFINVQLSSQNKETAESEMKKVKVRPKEEADRRSLIMQQDEIKELASKVAKLEQMAHRNRKEKSVYDAVCRKLDEARRALSEAQAAHSSTARAVCSKEQEKKWLRF